MRSKEDQELERISSKIQPKFKNADITVDPDLGLVRLRSRKTSKIIDLFYNGKWKIIADSGVPSGVINHLKSIVNS